ncbi:MAG: hypothetical protein IPG42_14640 [Betaproteobacteria bacterium]|nr:hypothetical protein [Betaproteobacteria bacterium]
MRTSTPLPALRQARQHSIEYGTAPVGAVHDRLARDPGNAVWLQACYAHGPIDGH